MDFGLFYHCQGRGVPGEFTKLGLSFDEAPAMTEEAPGRRRAALATRPETPGDGPYRPRLLLCRETYLASHRRRRGPKAPWALQGFWYLSSLAAPPRPSEYSDARLKELTGRVWGGRTYDELAAIGGMLIGSPGEVAD